MAGIERINAYVGRCWLDIAELARARGLDVAHIRDEWLCLERSVYPAWEDAVTLAVNAAEPLLDDDIKQRIDLLIVATESGLDYSKSLSTWVHRYLGLPSRCRTFEVKHACYGGTAALKMAATSLPPGRKALVINSDYTRFAAMGDPREPLGGGAGIAVIVGDEPDVLELEPGAEGYWAAEVHDFLRPAPTDERLGRDGAFSVCAYLDALDGAYEHLEERLGGLDYVADFRAHVYHAPFPGMTIHAHRCMLQRAGIFGAQAIAESVQQRVAPGLCFGQRLGSTYGGSTFVGLLGLCSKAGLAAGDPISIFAYGSGSQAEFYRAKLGPKAIELVQAGQVEQRLDERLRLTVSEYDGFERFYEEHACAQTFDPMKADGRNVFERGYAGSGLLVLTGVQDYQRSYGRA